LPLIFLQEVQPGSTQAEYDRVRLVFVHGYLEESQLQAEHGYRRSLRFNPGLAAKFLLLEAESMLWRGLSEDALHVLAVWSPASATSDDVVQERALEGAAFSHLKDLSEANGRFSQAANLCAKASYPACGDLLMAQGMSAVAHGDFEGAREELLGSLPIARDFHDQFAESTAFLDLGYESLQSERFDEAVDWSTSAYRSALTLGAEDLAQNALGNLGWAYFKLGDSEKALDLFVEAEKSASRLGDPSDQIKWLANAGYVYQNTGNLTQAAPYYRRALELAKHINSEDDIATSLEDLAHISIEKGQLDEANSYVDQINQLIRTSGNRLDALDVMLAQGRIAAARREDGRAETIFRAVEKDPAAQTSMKLGAEHEIASLNERQGNTSAADQMYQTALSTFESARDQLKNEESKLPFLANATSIYDDFIHFLVAHGKADEALRIADQSRAQTLAQGLGVSSKTHSLAIPALRPSDVARKTDATLLFYWLGPKQSYLWAITPKKTELFPLPPQREITQSIERYRKTLLGFTDPVENSDADGLALYRMLVAPASAMLQPGSNVVILCDGALSQLNFETLIVPGPHPHYWIEDATLVSAPSLHLLGSANSAEPPGHKLLLFGDAVPPNADYPQLPMAASEMKQIEQHFSVQDQAVYSREGANAAAYLAGNPQQFAYIHFVAHGVASRTDPLDSAIILSRSSAAEDSFKLHAREIIQHPIHARLVTVSACYGSGTRSYAGEGLVGLAWAFLRAGAHGVIGALWEVSDDSTSQLMGDLYQGLERGMPPSAALRQAKLSLLRSQREFRKPFYWAPLQIYTGL
jgi:CHAT domain-containing protein